MIVRLILASLIAIIVLAVGAFLVFKHPSLSSSQILPIQPSLTNQPGPSQPNSNGTPAIAVMANAASSLPLRFGDYVIGSAGQQVNGTTSSQAFQQAISSLERVTTPGVNKVLGFSSISDLEADISSIPADINYIDYSTEQGTTPPSELDDLTSSVAKFAQIAHAHGKRMMWAPQHKYFDNLQSAGTLPRILTSVDLVQYQSQRLLTTDSNYNQDIQVKYTSAKAANPKVIFYLQLWVGTNGSTDQQIINGFNRLVGYFDVAGVGGGSQADSSIVISGLNWRR